jgi:hypothetical protein
LHDELAGVVEFYHTSPVIRDQSDVFGSIEKPSNFPR